MKGSKQCDELQIEISTLRKELKVAKENCSTMETEVWLNCLHVDKLVHSLHILVEMLANRTGQLQCRTFQDH